jgi:glycosyltransferase involved in cell wall biosynthesis
MSRIENYSAAINFIENSFPLVKAIFPLTKLYIIGSNPPSNLIKLSSESIIVTGYVEDPSAYFERASIGIAPLLEGAGIKVKVLEMLEVGLYTIATPVAAEGIVTNSNLKVCEMNSFHIEICNYWNVMVEK